MQLPLQVTFHNIPRSESIEEEVRRNAEKLDRFYDRIMSCRVVLDLPHRHHAEGNFYQVRIDLTVPGGEIVVKRGPGGDVEPKNIGITIREAFDEARRQIEEFARRRQGHVKVREAPAHARILRIVPGEDYGFLQTHEGREIYFHRNSVTNGWFDRLEEGTEVSFVEEEGNQGPQATTVRPVGRHGHRAEPS